MPKWIEWVEPFNSQGDPVYCRVTPETAIATQKHTAITRPRPYIYASDQQALDDFITVNWAAEVEYA